MELTGTVRGSLYPARMQGQVITVRVEDDYWGRCEEHRTWVRLEDLTEDVPEEPEPDDELPSYANGGYIVSGSISASQITAHTITAKNMVTNYTPAGFDIGQIQVYTAPGIGYAQADIDMITKRIREL